MKFINKINAAYSKEWYTVMIFKTVSSNGREIAKFRDVINAIKFAQMKAAEAHYIDQYAIVVS